MTYIKNQELNLGAHHTQSMVQKKQNNQWTVKTCLKKRKDGTRATAGQNKNTSFGETTFAQRENKLHVDSGTNQLISSVQSRTSVQVSFKSSRRWLQPPPSQSPPPYCTVQVQTFNAVDFAWVTLSSALVSLDFIYCPSCVYYAEGLMLPAESVAAQIGAKSRAFPV